MKRFDAIVVGGGSGLDISSALARAGLSVAIVEEGPLGGTCLNRGCIPSKIVIHSADVMRLLGDTKKFGITVPRGKVDFASITRRASRLVDTDAKAIEQGIRSNPNMTLYKTRAHFVKQKVLQVGKEQITAEKIFIMAGTRPTAPPVPGLDKVPYLTSTEALRLTRQPKHLVVLGGGYIAVELAHFFGGLGTKVTMIQRSPLLLSKADKEIATLFTAAFGKAHTLLLGYEVAQVSKTAGTYRLTLKSEKGKKTLTADQLLVATGRVPNSDLLDCKAGGIATNQAGYIVTNDFLETSVPGVWAAGDIAGKYQFKHSANLEAEIIVRNVLQPSKKAPVDYTAMPAAIFSSPQIASVGATEDALEEKQEPYLAGRYQYKNTGMGEALQEDGMVKFLVDPDTRKILGCHIIGPEASTLIHEVVVAMRWGLTVDQLAATVHIHPALSEVVQRAALAVE